MNEQRPKITKEIIKKAVENLAKTNGWSSQQIDDVVSHYSPYCNGYDLAKKLDSYCGWDIEMHNVEDLDLVDDEVREVYKEACFAWAKSCNIQPTLPIGTVTNKGEITGICEHEPACYLIREHGETNESRRLIVKFEDVESEVMV